jgi:hypothetical protein
MFEQCKASKKDGSRCLAQALPGRPTCMFHDEDLQAQRTEGRRKGGREHFKMRVVLPPETADAPLSTIPELAEFLAVTINQCRRGEIDCKIANAISTLAAQLMHALETMGDAEVAAQLEELRALSRSKPVVIAYGTSNGSYPALTLTTAEIQEIQLNEPPPD